MLVTGHTGFKGSWLVHWLHRLGAKVAGLALYPTDARSLWSSADVSRLLDEECLLDIRDPVGLGMLMDDFRPQVVFHLAAQSLVSTGLEHPVETIDINVSGSARVLELCRHLPGLEALLVVTTDKCYAPSRDQSLHREGDRLGGHDPYAASKAAAEIIVEGFRHSLWPAERGLMTLRAGNVIGGGDWGAKRLVPEVIAALEAGQVPALRRPHATRPWIYVCDLLAGYLLTAEALCADPRDMPPSLNFGPDQVRSVGELAEAISTHWGADGRTETGYERFREETWLALDSELARSRLSWQPLYGFELASERTASWYRRFNDGESAYDLLTAELEDFHRRAGEKQHDG